MIPVDVRLVTYSGLPGGEPDTPLVGESLRRRGLTWDVRVWNDPDVDWDGAAVTILRSTWDYHLDRAGFIEWLGNVGRRTRLHNPARLVEWNTHKGYLVELQRRGLPVVPTVVVRPGDRFELSSLTRSHGWDRVVLKPAVSLDGHDVFRGAVDSRATREDFEFLIGKGDVIVQPYVASVVDRGELSVTFIDGGACHAVRKLPAAGDFRVQTRLGGSVEPAALPHAAADIGARALATLPRLPLYARVDLVEDAGGYRITELELIEPSLFITYAPSTADTFAAAIEARLGD